MPRLLSGNGPSGSPPARPPRVQIPESFGIVPAPDEDCACRVDGSIPTRAVMKVMTANLIGAGLLRGTRIIWPLLAGLVLSDGVVRRPRTRVIGVPIPRVAGHFFVN